MADLSALLDKTFGGKHFTPNTPALRLTIKSVQAKEVGEDREVKPLASFVEDARNLVVNSTKYTVLAEANGSRDVEKWPGTVVELYHDVVKFKRDMVPTVGLRVITPAPKAA